MSMIKNEFLFTKLSDWNWIVVFLYPSWFACDVLVSVANIQMIHDYSN